MESPLILNPYPKFSKDQILNTFKASCASNETILTLAEFLPDIFSNDIIEPENCQQLPQDFNINDALLENIVTPRPMKLVAQKRVYIPKSPFSSSGYADEPTLRVWYYLDEGNNIQGPFTSLEMDFWFDSGFFFNELLIRIKENNDFVKLIHLFGKTEIIQVYKPALMTPMGGHMLIDQAPMSAGIKTAEPMSANGIKPVLEKKQSIYTFGFEAAEENASSPLKEPNTADTPTIKAKSEEEKPAVETDEVKQPSICVNNTDLVEKEGEKGKEEKSKEIIKDNKESPVEEGNEQKKKNENNNKTYLDVKGQKEDKILLSPSGYKKNQRGPESSKKKDSYIEVYEPKTSPCPDKSGNGNNGKQDTRKNNNNNNNNKGRDQGQQSNKQGTMLQYVVKGEKKEEPEPVKEKREKYNNNNNSNNKGGNNNNNHSKKNNNNNNERGDQAIAGTPGKKGQDMVIFVPKKKVEVTYAEKSKSDKKDTPEKIYVPKQQQQHQQHHPKGVTDVLPDLQPGFFQRKESDTFEVLKATSEYYQTDTTKDSSSGLPPGLQPEGGLGPVMNGRNFQKKPKDRLRLVNQQQCDDYEKEQERVVATSLGLLDLEEEPSMQKKAAPTKSLFKNNSATPSPLIIDNKTVGKLYNFNEDLKYSSFSNQAENFPEKEC